MTVKCFGEALACGAVTSMVELSVAPLRARSGAGPGQRQAARTESRCTSCALRQITPRPITSRRARKTNGGKAVKAPRAPLSGVACSMGGTVVAAVSAEDEAAAAQSLVAVLLDVVIDDDVRPGMLRL